MARYLVVVILSLLMSAGILFLPVNAEDSAGPDTSGSDLDIGAIAVGMLDNDLGVIMSPPRWQWDAGRYMVEGKKCAEKCESLHEKYIKSPENSPEAGSFFNQGIAFCECAQKNYNMAFQLTGNDDYLKQAEIFDAGTSLYDSIGMTREAQQTRRAATAARAQAAAASSIFLPLSPFIALAGLAGAFLLVNGKRE